ncbi:MAG: histidine--tRNA ligase [Clostridia bacterium]|nr:histidine--tRNA ligase [Clostridia bacterium]
MAQIKAMRGTQDLLPANSHEWKFAEDLLMNIAASFGYKELRTPVFESTELFARGVGDTTDVVQKEMYTFEDKGGRSITLRPEGTAGAVRAAIEHSLLNEALPVKLSYLTSCYRYEKPQAGRLREFHQFGVECLGTASPAADAQLILFAAHIFDAFGLEGITLELNSIGCPKCRATYHAALKAYFAAHTDTLCPTCKDRLEKNPMRILDCKNPECKEIAKDAPVILDYLCEECSEHFEKVKAYLDITGVPFKVNPRIVRGLDYYTKTVFEFVSNEIGAQGTVLGGGRYDGLIEELGGKQVPALGFAMGIERLMLVLKAQNYAFPAAPTPDIFLCSIGENAFKAALTISDELCADGFAAEVDILGRSVKAQMKYANKIGAKYTAVIGDDDIEKGVLNLKNMETGESIECAFEQFVETFENEYIAYIEQHALSNTLDVGEEYDG